MKILFIGGTGLISSACSALAVEVEWAEGVRRSLAWFEARPEFQTVDREASGRWDDIISAFERAFPS